MPTPAPIFSGMSLDWTNCLRDKGGSIQSLYKDSLLQVTTAGKLQLFNLQRVDILCIWAYTLNIAV